MSLHCEERLSNSPYVDTIEHVVALQDGHTICPANGRWYMLISREGGKQHVEITGPLTRATPTTYCADSEFIFIKFKMGIFLRHFPARHLLDDNISLPVASDNHFWLDSCAWQFPDYQNIETFIERLARQDLLICDPLVNRVLQDEEPHFAERTIRQRFVKATGLTQKTIRQIERARFAKSLLEQGMSIFDVVYESGYYDQPHLTRALKQFTGYTPAQIARKNPSV